jgi:hypothetical protein
MAMTPDQKQWLDEHPNYSPVRENMVVSMTAWTDKGWLFASGRFVADDGKTLFPHKYSWFPRGRKPYPVHVGRHYEIV